MDLKQLEYFVAVIEKGSFSRAAVAMNLAQPSLSRQVALLEGEFGQRLLERTGRGVRPTEAGTSLLSHARVMLNAATQARFHMTEMSSEPTGRVVVGLPHRVANDFCVPIIREFRARLPRAMISVVEGLSLSLRDALIGGQIDVAVLFDPAPTQLLSYEKLMREKLVLVAPASTRLKEQVSIADLAQFPMVLPSAPNPIRSLVDAVLLPRKVSLKIIAEVGGVNTALNLVKSGLACSILPSSAVHRLPDADRLMVAQIGPPAMWNSLVLALPTARPLTRLTQETTSLLRSIRYAS
jgi:LysR family nitrogen assimilation transcriptional regulator